MERNPYRLEITVTLVLAPVLVAVETWRRWGELLAPEALDDWLIALAALYVVWRLSRRDPTAPALWLMVCGAGFFLFVLSLWGSIHGYSAGDPSGAPMPAVIAFKTAGVTLFALLARRAVQRVR